MKLYLASKTIHAQKWIELRASGYNIISSWIDEAGAGASQNLESLAERCIKESSECDFLILYRENPDEILKGAYIEAGSALAFGKFVAFVGTLGDLRSSAFRNHPNWLEFETIEDALAFLNDLHSKINLL